MNKSIIIIILILCFLGVIVFLDVPKVQEILELRKNIEKQKQVFEDKQLLLAKIQRLIKLYDENEQNVKKVDYILPEGEEISNLIVQFEALAFEGGMIMQGIEFLGKDTKNKKSTTSTEVQKYKSLEISIDLVGSYSSLKSFLDAAERNIRLIDISSINITPSGEDAQEFFNFSVILKVYYQ